MVKRAAATVAAGYSQKVLTEPCRDGTAAALESFIFLTYFTYFLIFFSWNFLTYQSSLVMAGLP